MSLNVKNPGWQVIFLTGDKLDRLPLASSTRHDHICRSPCKLRRLYVIATFIISSVWPWRHCACSVLNFYNYEKFMIYTMIIIIIL